MHKGIIIFGLCKLTKGALDIFQRNNLVVYGILEDTEKWHRTEIEGVPILGSTNDPAFLTLLHEASPFFLAHGDPKKRQYCLNYLTKTAQIKSTAISAIHPSATITHAMQLGAGNYIGAQVCLAAEVTIGNYTILYNGVIVEPQTTIHDWVSIGAGSIIGEEVTIKERVTIGMGAKIMPGVTIGEAASIRPAAVVTTNVKSGVQL
ncbi:Putative acetyltransferase EpsM [Candidatus Cardinium hertigii]|uniref:Acetyltransferase EpsM n=2 Tax=Candidatus Cardinium hertigii TaxID=247481 RepID=A0A2Z3LHZ4_9BACT|nr:Putative acetyltransferase EpsM [Candidatus Cardinium hertigii]